MTEQVFKGAIHGQVAGRDIVNNHIERLEIRGDLETTSPMLSRRAAAERIEQLEPVRERISVIRKELRRMFVRHPSVRAFFLSWVVYLAMVMAFWGQAMPIPHGLLLVAWGFLVVVPTAWAMGRSRQPILDGLLDMRRQLRAVERQLAIAEAERRTDFLHHRATLGGVQCLQTLSMGPGGHRPPPIEE